jgi:hypothetical protein
MDQMKDYKQLIKELPSNTIVCAVGEFNPPTVGHELLVKTVKKLAEQKHSAHVIYTSPSKNSLIQEDKKAHYLNLMFPKISFKSLNESNLQEAITELHKKYKKIILVVGTDQITEMRKLQNVELIPVDKDPEADNTKMKQFASKGVYEEFKKKLPSTIRDIDGKRLMNEMRNGLGLEPIKEQIVFVKDKLREKYFRGEIFNEGDIVESNGEKFTIVKRGSNHLLLKEATGKLISKWIQDVKPTEEKEMNESSKLAEGAIQPNGTDKIDTKTSEPMNADNKTADVKVKKGMITFYNYSKAQNIKEQKHKGTESQADHKKDNESDIDADFDSHQADKREVGHTLVSPGGQDNLRRRKVKYHLGEASALEKFRAAAAEREKKHDAIEAKRKADAEQGKENMSGSIDRLEKQLNKEQTGMELAKKIHQKGMTTYGKEGGHELTAQHVATDPEHTAKQKKLAQSFISRMQGVAENVTPDKASNEVAKANLSAKHAKEKESLADKHAREKEALKEDNIDELNRSTIKSYLKKKINKPGVPTQKDVDGIGRAAVRLMAKEEAELDEAKKKPLVGVVATAKPVDPFFEEDQLEERAKIRKKFINGEWVVDVKNTVDENYDQTIDVATPNTAIETSEEDDIDDKEIEAMIGNLSDEEIMDEYGEDELGLVDDETGEEIPKSPEEDALDEQAIMEVLSRIERMKAKFRIRRTAAKRERATKIALKRYSNTATINKRARRLAIKLMKQRILRGRDISKLSVGEKERVERMLEKRKAIIGRIATRLAPRVRKVEKARMSHTKYTQGSQQSVF